MTTPCFERGCRRHIHRGLRAGTALAILVATVIAIPADAYVRPGATEIVSVAADGSQGSEPENIPLTVQGCTLDCTSDISANGRFVAFESPLEDLVPGDTNKMADIFVKDLRTGAIERGCGVWVPEGDRSGPYLRPRRERHRCLRARPRYGVDRPRLVELRRPHGMSAGR